MRRERDRRAVSGRVVAPPSLAALAPAIWLEPNALDTLVSGRVSQAWDLSGNANHAVQGTAAQRPLLSVGTGPGGRDCWQFLNSRPDHLSVPHVASLAGLDWTCFALLKTALSAASIVSKTNAGAARPVDGIIFGNVMNLAGERAGVTAVNSNTWRRVGFRRGVALAEASVWVDGVRDAFGAVSSFTNTSDEIRIGRRLDGFGALTGDIAHVSIWTRALSNAEILSVNAYFLARFGL